MKASKKIKRRLVARQRAYDELRQEDKQGTRRPGSMNGAK